MNRVVFAAYRFLSSLSQGQLLSAAFIDTVLIGNRRNAPIEVGATPTDTRWFKTGTFGSVSNDCRLVDATIAKESGSTGTVTVDGTDLIILAGALNLTADPGYSPSLGDMFTIIRLQGVCRVHSTVKR